LEAAGDYYSEIILDELAALIPSGANTLGLRFSNPVTGTTVEVPSLGIPANTIIIFVGSRNLPGNNLGTASSGADASFGTDAWLELIDNRGQIGNVYAPNANEMSTWGGSIAIDTIDADGAPRTWDYSLEGGAANGRHLFSILIHEIAHVIGFGNSDSWKAWQMNGNFMGNAIKAVHGAGVPLELGSPSHWVENTMSNIYGTSIIAETAMDPILDIDTKSPMTELDLAGLKDVGWEVASPPVIPAAPQLSTRINASGVFVISWIGSEAFNYQVESANQLTVSSWENASPILPGVEGAMSFNAELSTANFYRVKSSPKAVPVAALQVHVPLPVAVDVPAPGSLRYRTRDPRNVCCDCD
jgi:hypothetical protein